MAMLPDPNFKLTDEDWEKTGSNGTLGLYQFTPTTLLDIGASKTAFVRRKASINIIILFITTVFNILSVNAYADQVIYLHKPSPSDKLVLKNIFENNKDLYEDFNSKYEYNFTMDDIELATTHILNGSYDVIIRVNNFEFDGSVGEGFYIWEKNGNS